MIFVTGSRGKLASATRYLACTGIQLGQVDLQLDEIQDLSVRNIALRKAWDAYRILRGPLFIEDGGFYIDELGGFPGPFAKYVVQTVGPAGILRLADMTASRTAHFESALVYVDHTGACQVFLDSSQTGTVALAASAERHPDAWSPIWDVWVPDGYDVPLAALSDLQLARRAELQAPRSVFGQFAAWLAASEQHRGI